MIPSAAPAHAAAVLALALALDLAAGEYPARLHPVVWMGRVISRLEALAPAAGRWRQLAWGLGAALLVPALFAGGALLLVRLLDGAPAWLAVPLEALALKATFAVRALGGAAGAVGAALEGGRLDEARRGLRALCSRDPSGLDGPRVAAAAIESVAENASDSAVAPLLAYALLGLPGAVAYRAVNTLDARIGYRGRYEWLGKAAARLDDLVNLLPSRLTAALLLAAGPLAGGDLAGGLRIARRDAGRTASPNAGWPMAAMAGLLGVELEKVGHYRLGDPLALPGAGTVAASWRIARAAVLGFAAALAAALAAAALLGVRRG
ncbi:MAG TPA: adenosylcobinamide-phosphate synthase CbiB [Anaeromyxobacteraceae bacterium]|nr:adenosylcobinamide-phosphate synthase CbiB [Anaeromyxobacteraceae bacterium]